MRPSAPIRATLPAVARGSPERTGGAPLAPLRHVDPLHPAGPLARGYARLAATRLARALSRAVGWRLDPVLLRLTRGRVASTLFFPTAVLETTGARTGAARRHAVIHFPDGDRTVVVASHAGAPRHPGWFHNLLAHPDVRLGGVPMRASVVADDAERARIWALADNVFPTYATYREEAARAGRTIPLVVLTRRAPRPVGPVGP